MDPNPDPTPTAAGGASSLEARLRRLLARHAATPPHPAGHRPRRVELTWWPVAPHD